MTAEPSATPPAIRVLLLVSNPLDAPISIADNVAALEDTVRDLAVSAEFMVRVAETDAIGSLLAQRNRPPFHVLHYLGHGNRLPDAPSGYLILEDKMGGARALEPFRLHAVLNPTGTPDFELAVLSACHSESVAEAIISLGVRHIVAIEADASVYEIAAVQFYRRFYQTLLTGGTVQEAFTAGRNAVLTDARLSREAGHLPRHWCPSGGSERATEPWKANVSGRESSAGV